MVDRAIAALGRSIMTYTTVLKKSLPNHPWRQDMMHIQFTDTDINTMLLNRLALWNSSNRHLLDSQNPMIVPKGVYILHLHFMISFLHRHCEHLEIGLDIPLVEPNVGSIVT